jgi:hypothetical protein
MTTNTQELAFIIANRLKSNMGGGIKSIQRGVFTSSAGNTNFGATVTISHVDTTKTTVWTTGHSSSSVNTTSSHRIALTNSNTLTITYTCPAGTTLYVGWQVVEYY